MKNIVCGLGEIGSPIYRLLSKNHVVTVGYDLDKSLMNQKEFDKYQSHETEFIHICIPFSKNFVKLWGLLQFNSGFQIIFSKNP